MNIGIKNIKIFSIINSVVIVLGTTVIGSFLYSSSFSAGCQTDTPVQKQPKVRNCEIVSPEIPANLDFCGERVPLEHFYVRERIDREMIVNTYFHSATILAVKRANRWFPVIEPILKKNGIPADFKYLCVVESNLDNAVSSAGAAGFWQFIEPTAKSYGLEINDMIDERYNIEKATEAACQYLLTAYNKYHNWTLAAASYNIGFGGVDRQIERQKMTSYYDILFGEETSRYVARIIAMKEIFRDPQKYGYFINKNDYYIPLESTLLAVDSNIPDLALFAISKGFNYKILKIYNPWLRDNLLIPQKGKTYFIKIPK
ncbi:MAG: lytic transglycosylase domain-containing protein [Ignavibacteria bacterium]